jgi:arylsulfatase A-like enzyme
VLLIVWDTVRAGNLSAYGYGRRTTPNLERLAGRGVRFDPAFSTSSWTLPAHASLFTGQWPHELGEYHDVRMAIDVYDDCIAYLDRRLGILLQELGRRGVLDDMLVIVTADHGEHLGDHLLFFHGCSLYRQLVQVPLVIVDPPRIPGSPGGDAQEAVGTEDQLVFSG